MDKKSIIVSINGKKDRVDEDNRSDRSHDMSFSHIHDRHYMSKDSDISDQTKQNTSKKSQSPFQQIKPLLIAIFSAITIGTLLGLMMLVMFKGLGDETPAQPAVTENNENNEDEEKIKGNIDDFNVESLQAHVLQAGVFSKKDNAEQWSKTYQDKNYPTLIWERDGDYYLFVGISNTREQGKNDAEKLMKLDLEVFVKEWSTKSFDIELSEDESDWIQSFQTLWGQSVDSIGKEFLIEEWNKLIDQDGIESDKLDGLQNEIHQHLENDPLEDQLNQQYFLLSVWYEFEQLLQNNK